MITSPIEDRQLVRKLLAVIFNRFKDARQKKLGTTRHHGLLVSVTIDEVMNFLADSVHARAA
jgi:hypothetical protein